METILQEVLAVLQKSPHTYWREYMEIYQKATGSRWQGCRCKSDKIRQALQEWYNLNKTT